MNSEPEKRGAQETRRAAEKRVESVGEVTVSVPRYFAELCKANGVTPKLVLTAFLADLCETPASNGSDERRCAEAWFDRVLWECVEV